MFVIVSIAELSIEARLAGSVERVRGAILDVRGIVRLSTLREANPMSEMRVVGVRVELPANQPILLLRETEGERYLPIWIGSVEATAIALEQQGVRPARPLTHDLLKDVIGALGRELEQVRITDLRRARSSPSSSSTATSACPRGPATRSRSRCGSVCPSTPRSPCSPEAGSDHPGRAGGRGREVPRVPRLGLPRGLPRCRHLVVGRSRVWRVKSRFEASRHSIR